MEETAKMESHLSSAAAFVEGGIQDACDDACSICLEEFCESDPQRCGFFRVTSCKHEFHLQCILEWCQRSSQCPMCWRPISLKDPGSQELLEAVEEERSFRVNRSRTATIIHHPVLGDFELQHLPVGADDAEFEERIIQHLAAAAAMRRTSHTARREGHRGRSSAVHGRPQLLVFSAHQNAPSVGSVSASSARSENEPVPTIVADNPSASFAAVEEGSPHEASPINSAPVDPAAASPSMNSATFASNRSSAGQFSPSLKSRLNAVSIRYKDSITKSTRGWRDRLFSRNSVISDFGSEVRREVNAGIATVSRMMDRLETRDNVGPYTASTPLGSQIHSAREASNERVTSNSTALLNNATPSASCAASSAPK
uniref:RING-type E3 ubiquitin transferase n=1 Tax=Ananas comosus var. bracteatus TaxID=296719 RepID=A0A6V7QF02_ANACO|nr:unnamed protein product [Ananas comosus var. bracteatus]